MTETMTLDKADYMARVFVCGLREAAGVPASHPLFGKRIIASGEWSTNFLGHPWVKRSQIEGFAPDLRTHCIAAVKARIVAGTDYTNVSDLMPDKAFVEALAAQAARHKAAAEWREQAVAEFDSVDNAIGRGRRLDRNWRAAPTPRNVTGERDA